MDLREVAAALGLAEGEVETRGSHAKVRLSAAGDVTGPRGRYVLVTAMTPDKAGIGKTVTAIGLAMGLRRSGASAAVTLRQSSLGPTLGMKGGGAGGGVAGIVPLEHSLLGLGEDLHAVESANNLLAAALDDAIFRGADIDPATVTWRRVLDVDDRALRRVTVRPDGTADGTARETGFDITAASEVMAVLALATDLVDLQDRLGRIVPAWTRDGRPVTARDLKADGAMAVLLKDALMPNLMQTTDGTPALLHAGPFGNIATGCSSVVADRVALPRVDYVVTEAGFGSDLGAEKLVHLKSPVLGVPPDAAVLVVTLRALRAHGGGSAASDVAAVEKGCENLRRHLGILQALGVPAVVALNSFPGDSADESAAVLAAARGAGARAVLSEPYTEGAAGCADLAEAVAEACGDLPPTPVGLRRDAPVVEKVRTIATRIYGADEVIWSTVARERLAQIEAAGYGRLPVCVAKTHLSLSADPKLIGAPVGFDLPVRDLRLAAGAGFVTVYAGDIMTMPGLPSSARFQQVRLDERGEVVGLV
jgi:formate--tetrahydrofolate ligase